MEEWLDITKKQRIIKALIKGLPSLSINSDNIFLKVLNN